MGEIRVKMRIMRIALPPRFFAAAAIFAYDV